MTMVDHNLHIYNKQYESYDLMQQHEQFHLVRDQEELADDKHNNVVQIY